MSYKVHEIKLLEDYCDAVLSGEKTFEVRKNDRGYQKGDHICFAPVDRHYRQFFHRVGAKEYEITYVHSGLGLEDGYVVFGIKDVSQDGKCEKEKLKAEVNGYFYSLNAAGKIDWSTYSTLYDVCISIIEKYYDRMEKGRRAESEEGMNNKRAVTTEKDQKIGKWRYDGKTLICSICNTWFHVTDRIVYMRHCPYCGAKMEGGEK